MIRPVQFRWQTVEVCVEGGEVRRVPVMVPHSRFARLCKRQYEEGEDYALGPVEGVPSRSRAAIFAQVHDTWDNLPEGDERFPSEEHLRKVALCKAGWAMHSQTNWKTKEDARQHAIDLRKVDAYAVISVHGEGNSWTVDVWVAKSIAAGQITDEEFKVVKKKVLAWLASLTGTTAEELERNERAA